MSTDKNYITDEELTNNSHDNNLLNRNVMFFDNYLITPTKKKNETKRSYDLYIL